MKSIFNKLKISEIEMGKIKKIPWIFGFYAFPIILKEGVKFMRDEFTNYLEKNGIEIRSLFASIPTQCQGFEFLGYKSGEFPEAEYIGNNGLHIGIHQDITQEHLDYFLSTTEKFLKENS